ncbi:hypothetical protein [Amycolatopsis sp. NPDC021455]|uniref:hypothetical protein n=1 Tax=Amycolatopsis sp. NPDC021455 TaxID=3154901 RepID=UPI0033D28E14
MTSYPDFGVLLRRLAASRNLDLDRLPVGVPAAELQPVLRGSVPAEPSLLRRLAPVLVVHAADLFVIARVPVPGDLAPVDPAAGREAVDVAGLAKDLPPEHRSRLLRSARSLSRQDSVQPVPGPPAHVHYAPGAGAVLIRLFEVRNLGWTSSAKVLHLLTGVSLSAATMGAVGHGRKELTPGLAAAFAVALGLEFDIVAAISGVTPSADVPRIPVSAELAQLVWELRRLTVAQIGQLVREAG